MATVASPSREECARAFFADPARYLSGNYRIVLRAEIVAQMLSEIDPGDVIDLGCGDGVISNALLPRARSLTLLDASPDMLAAARRRFGEAATYICGDLHAPPRGPFDTALCTGILAHVDSTERVLRAAANCLKPGGHLVLQLSDSSSVVTQINLALGRIFGSLQCRPTRLSEALAAAADEGFSTVSMRRYLLAPAGVPRLLGHRVLPFERAAMRRRWLARHAGDVMLLLRKAVT